MEERVMERPAVELGVEERMTVYPAVVNENTPAKEALARMIQQGFRHLPVVDGDEVIGVVSERDILRMEVFLDSMHLLVGDVMSREPYVVSIGTPLSEVAREMARQKLGSAVVVNGRNAVVGIFTTTDGMRILADCLEGASSPRLREAAIEHYFEWEN